HPGGGPRATGRGRRSGWGSGLRRAAGGRRGPMIPAPFDYERAQSVDQAIELLGRHGEDAKLLAGGHSLLPLMKLRLARPSVLIDIDRVSELSFIREAGDQTEIGATARVHEVAGHPLLGHHNRLVAYSASVV